LNVGFLALGYHNSGLTGSKKNLEPLEFTGGIEAVRRYLPGLRQRCDFAVILSHMGTAMDRVLAQEVPEVELIIGAHSHDRISAERVGQTVLVQAGSDASVLGETVVSLEDGKVARLENRLHTLWSDQYPDDPEMSRLLEKLRRPHQADLDEVIGRVGAPIGRNYRSESPFDKLVGEMMCQELDAEVAFLPGVGYGITLLPGPLTREALYTLIPHPAKVITLDLTGAQILEILEQSALNQKPGDPRRIVGGLVQTAGLRWRLDYGKPSGSRISQVSVRGQPLQKEQTYRSATNSGMQGGLHNYTTFAQGQNIQEHDLRLHHLVEQAIRKISVLNPPEMGDIILGDEA
jgi:5'-nucleotidase / UDP-sugar diphosphatase